MPPTSELKVELFGETVLQIDEFWKSKMIDQNKYTQLVKFAPSILLNDIKLLANEREGFDRLFDLIMTVRSRDLNTYAGLALWHNRVTEANHVDITF